MFNNFASIIGDSEALKALYLYELNITFNPAQFVQSAFLLQAEQAKALCHNLYKYYSNGE